MRRCTKIVATLGPASQDETTIRHLLTAGVNVARLNFSHGSHADHARSIQLLREASARLGKPLCILQDLQGPKMRVGDLASGEIKLIPGQPLTLTIQQIVGEGQVVPVDFPGLPQNVEPGSRILLDDGNLELVATAVFPDRVETQVVVGGVLKSNKGINLPGSRITVSALTEKDEADLAFGLQNGVDAVALSFVQSKEDILHLRQVIARLSPDQTDVLIIAKLERPQALENLEEIVASADGVMVARGDLGVEMSPEAVPIAQKRIIECANRHGRIVITATQMLESMIHNPRPTRAEASDVANAILDGTDAVMLSGETAVGRYPVRAVQMMDAIIRQAEQHLEQWGHWKGQFGPASPNDDAYYVTRAACELAHDRNVAAIAVFTQSGRTALLMSKARPEVPILAFTPREKTYRRLALCWGVDAQIVPHASSIEAMLADVEAALMASGPVQPGQQVVLVCGFPVGQECAANLALLHTVGI